MNFFDYPIRGVDLSTYDGAVNWDILNTKIRFAIPRIGYGRTLDAQFKANWAGCKVVKQAYWYLDYYSNWYNPKSSVYGISNYEWGKRQAQNAYNFVGESAMTWLDIESGGASYSPPIHTCWNRVEEMMDGWFAELDALNGKENGVYCSVGWLSKFDKRFVDKPLWVAWYSDIVDIEDVLYSVTMNGWTGRVWYWQYASDGDTDADGDGDGKSLGLTRNVGDLDIWLGTADEWNKPDDFTGSVPQPEPEVPLYRVRVTIPNLLIRGGAGASYPVVYRYATGEHEVYEEKNGYGRIGAGKWIALEYTQKLGTLTLEERVTALEKAVFGG